MTALGKLEKNLQRISQVALAKMQLGDRVQILHERALLEKWVGAVLEDEGPAADRLQAALEQFQKSNQLRGLRQARLVCYGLLQPFGPQSIRMLDDVEHLTLLLKYLDRHRGRTRPYRKCYRGLLNCYFSYDPQGKEASIEGRRNWEMLRDYLFEHCRDLQTQGYNPEWVEVLAEQAELLSGEPFGQYRFDQMQGDWTPLEELRERLEVDEESWFMRRLVLGQVEAVVALDDEAFTEYLDHLLLLLSDYDLYASEGLVMLLDRYARCANVLDSASLRDFSVNQWGNPWLATNAQNWQCGSAAREMVAQWLKRHLLHQFFALFSDEDAAGPRRLNFWELYCDDMLGMYFALGKNAFAPGNMDYYRFRNDARGLVVKLSGGAQDLHAFIMQFDRHHVVEFSRNNNVAYFYDTRHGPPPFYFSEGWIKVGALSVGNALKGGAAKPVSKSLRHKDGMAIKWEAQFAQEMGVTANAIRAFCRKYRSRYEDKQQDGRNWLYPDSGQKCEPFAHAVLVGWGFTWSPDKQGYFRLAAS